MKRILFVAIFMVSSMSLVHSQVASFGLKGGLNFSSFPDIQTGQTVNYTVTSLKDAYTGFHLGLVGYFKLLGFFVQPELLYTQNGREMTLASTTTPNVITFFTQKYSHLSLPVHVGMSFGPIKLGGGPVFSLPLHQWDDLENIDFDQAINNLMLGYQLGVGIKLGGLMVDVRYEGSLNKLGKGLTVGGQTINFDSRPQQFILSLGLMF